MRRSRLCRSASTPAARTAAARCTSKFSVCASRRPAVALSEVSDAPCRALDGRFAATGASTRGSGCWTWSNKGAPPQCIEVKGWNGGQGRKYAPPPPPPPPGAPLPIYLPSGGPVATKLPFTPNASYATSPSGEIFGADSVSLLRGTSADSMERFYAIGGEIHLARVPSAVWKEQLMRMKAGGLNTVAVYLLRSTLSRWPAHLEWPFDQQRAVSMQVRLLDSPRGGTRQV